MAKTTVKELKYLGYPVLVEVASVTMLEVLFTKHI